VGEAAAGPCTSRSAPTAARNNRVFPEPFVLPVEDGQSFADAHVDDVKGRLAQDRHGVERRALADHELV